jgi:protein-disulfide isomerase
MTWREGEGVSTLTPPVGDHDHAPGSPEAPVTLVEYGDYECPYSGRAHPVVRAVRAHFGALPVVQP